MPKYIIGLTGSLGSGCTTTAKYLEEKEYKRISISSDILRLLAKEHEKLFEQRDQKQNFGNYVRKELRNIYKEKLLDSIEKGGDKVVVECF